MFDLEEVRAVKALAVILCALGLSLSSSVVFADEPEVTYKKRTQISFEEDTIDGTLNEPDQLVIDKLNKAPIRSLVRIRQSFRLQILQSLR